MLFDETPTVRCLCDAQGRNLRRRGRLPMLHLPASSLRLLATAVVQGMASGMKPQAVAELDLRRVEELANQRREEQDYVRITGVHDAAAGTGTVRAEVAPDGAVAGA